MASFLASLTSTILLRFLSEVMEGGGGVREEGEGWRERRRAEGVEGERRARKSVYSDSSTPAPNQQEPSLLSHVSVLC